MCWVAIECFTIGKEELLFRKYLPFKGAFDIYIKKVCNNEDKISNIDKDIKHVKETFIEQFSFFSCFLNIFYYSKVKSNESADLAENEYGHKNNNAINNNKIM